MVMSGCGGSPLQHRDGDLLVTCKGMPFNAAVVSDGDAQLAAEIREVTTVESHASRTLLRGTRDVDTHSWQINMQGLLQTVVSTIAGPQVALSGPAISAQNGLTVVTGFRVRWPPDADDCIIRRRMTSVDEARAVRRTASSDPTEVTILLEPLVSLALMRADRLASMRVRDLDDVGTCWKAECHQQRTRQYEHS
jgi:hypothetical protein